LRAVEIGAGSFRPGFGHGKCDLIVIAGADEDLRQVCVRCASDDAGPMLRAVALPDLDETGSMAVRASVERGARSDLADEGR
jgi:hypothetical protein